MLKIYNTLTGNKEVFQPINENIIKIYVCGPTVYDYCHVGHARAGVAFDVIRRYLEWRFPEKRVVFITNFTDVDLKMIKRAREEGVTIFELADRFIKQYFQDFDALNVKRASYYPRATDHIPDMIKFIEGLIERGFAYEVEGSVYFDIDQFKNYGQLSHKKLEELQPSEEAEEMKKKSPHDFALWKKRKDDEPFWESPWGPGRPGWHIECSAMSIKYLGDTFDIHGGGLDLIFPHHENEIAQSEALTGETFSRWFVHNNFITLLQEKMSKSVGNFRTIQEILTQYSPMAVRFFLISTHYRSPIDFNEEQISQAQQRYKRFQLALAFSGQKDPSSPISDTFSSELEEIVEKTRKSFIEAMDDDFSTPRAIASINNLVKYVNGLAAEKETVAPEFLRQAHNLLLELGYVLGLVKSPGEEKEEILINNLVKFILELRKDARDKKQYEIADRIRDKLKELGITLLDYPTRTIWTKE
ncbi:MAG: cysteine--tRNA ligase [Candidatus Helarchaeota archaeon]|nr:cysteine--tRNA ligase [Candidatus Helarchaeota archaeon]